MARRLRELLQVGFIASFFHERDGISLVCDSDITLHVRPRDSLSWSSNSIGIGIVDSESFKALGILRYVPLSGEPIKHGAVAGNAGHIFRAHLPP